VRWSTALPLTPPHPPPPPELHPVDLCPHTPPLPPPTPLCVSVYFHCVRCHRVQCGCGIPPATTTCSGFQDQLPSLEKMFIVRQSEPDLRKSHDEPGKFYLAGVHSYFDAIPGGMV